MLERQFRMVERRSGRKTISYRGRERGAGGLVHLDVGAVAVREVLALPERVPLMTTGYLAHKKTNPPLGLCGALGLDLL